VLYPGIAKDEDFYLFLLVSSPLFSKTGNLLEHGFGTCSKLVSISTNQVSGIEIHCTEKAT
jgi:hypothetical protein